jgi:hypothetical protein
MSGMNEMGASFGANNIRQAALLIDADNFADPQAIDAAWAELKAYAGRVSVCRAYGHGPRLQSLGSVWRYLGTRTFPNLPLEKNTTDAALIADAVALHFQQGIRLFAIASGDADFAPLAVRLREWGCEVWCFSIENIVFRDAETYYDRVKCFPAPVFAPTPMAPAPLRPAMPSAWGASADAAGADAAAIAMRPAYRPAAAPFQAPPVLDANLDADLPDEVARILSVVPGLRHRPQHLCHVVPVLERNGFFDKRVTKSTEFLRKHADYFELSPAYKPTLLTFRSLPAESPAALEPAAAAAAIFDGVPPQSEVDGDVGERFSGALLTGHQAGVETETEAAPAAAAPVVSLEDGQVLERIFAALPSWQPDTPRSVRSLRMMETLLNESGVSIGSKPLDELFAACPDYFEVLPADGPAEQVRLLKKPEDPVPAASDAEA